MMVSPSAGKPGGIEGPVPGLEKVTFLLHTSNRPLFLLRTLDHFDGMIGGQDPRLMILDASDDDHFARFQAGLAQRDHALSFELLRASRSLPLHLRIQAALERVSTPYVVLAADDDLYFFDWLGKGVALFDSDPSFGAVYGHTLWFELEEFAPYGANPRFFTKPVENPPERWLEGETARQRLHDVADTPSDLATTGWYALQRADHLRDIVDLGARHGLPDAFFERFLILAQAALTKTRRADEVFVARQVAKGPPRPPLSYRELAKDFDKLRSACRELLSRLGFDEASAAETIDYVYRNEIALMKRADAKRPLRQAANAVPILRTLWKKLVPNYDAPYPRDQRLPAPPPVDRCRREIEIVERLVTGPAAASAGATGLNRSLSRQA